MNLSELDKKSLRDELLSLMEEVSALLEEQPDVDKFLDADTDLNALHLKVRSQEEKLNLMTEIVKSVMGHSLNVI